MSQDESRPTLYFAKGSSVPRRGPRPLVGIAAFIVTAFVAAPRPASAQITLRNSVATTADGVTSIALSMPTGVQAMDVLIAQLAAYDTSAVPLQASPPSGWTTIISKSSSDGTEKEWIFYHVAGMSEPSSYTWQFNLGVNGQCTASGTPYACCTGNRTGTCSTVAGAAGGIADYFGVAAVGPLDAANGRFTANSTTITAPSLTTTVASDQLLCFMDTFAGVSTSNPNWTTPSGMTQHWLAESALGNIDVGFFDEALGTAGTVGDKTTTISPAADNAGILVALTGSASVAGVTNVVTNQGGGQGGGAGQCTNVSLPKNTYTLISTGTAGQPCADKPSWQGTLGESCDSTTNWTYIVRGHVTFALPSGSTASQVEVQTYIGNSSSNCKGGSANVKCSPSLTPVEDSTYPAPAAAPTPLNVSVPINAEEKLLPYNSPTQSFWVFAKPTGGSLTCTYNNYVTEEHN